MDVLCVTGLAAGLFSVVVSNGVVFFVSLIQRRRFRDRFVFRSLFYRDQDGEATDVSLRKVGGKWPCRAILFLSFSGLTLTSITIGAVLVGPVSDTNRHNDLFLAFLWCQFGSWILSLLQSVLLLSESSYDTRFLFANCGVWTGLGLVCLGSIPSFSWSTDAWTTPIVLQNSNTLVAVLRTALCLMVPRRPDVYHKGTVVDREQSAAMWSRLTLGYITPFVRYVGRNNKNFSIQDFPQLRSKARSEHLLYSLRDTQRQSSSLLRALAKSHSRGVLLQFTLSVFSALLSFGPQLSLFGILKGLENGVDSSLSGWVAALGTAICLSSTVTAWLWWISYSRLSIPLYSQLQGLIYAKCMSRKDIQQIGSENQEKQQHAPISAHGQNETINLVTIDTKRIADSVSYNHLVPSSVTQLIVACLLLLQLIGWEALIAGLLANLIASPVNLWVAKIYRKFQYHLTDARDNRASIVHEVIKNIRQVKFSALEAAWKQKVMAARQREVQLTLLSCAYETGFQAMWTLSPLILSSVSLTVYSLIHGQLTASIAFTSIAIFGSLEVALAALPHLISSALEAKISVDRIERFLQSPDKTDISSGLFEQVIFEGTAISWPTSDSSNDIGFTLTHLDFSFPPQALTVITGRTGSGKSLLLAAVLGEAELLWGKLEIPSEECRAWQCAAPGSGDWILDTAVAYVPQNPWTENGSIRNNICFGLPFDKVRYLETIFASGLERDMEILPEGDQTDIGANGVNLSGGQRARVSFARALYSRAGIIVMDDIFSALDADTSYHVYEYGLTGPLAQGRTRILATHHIGLCMPRTDFCVVLSNGTAACSGSIQELKQMESFSSYLALERIDEDDSASQRSQSVRSDQDTLREEVLVSKRFSPEEQRSTGSVSFRVYKQFFLGSPWIWAIGIFAALSYTACMVSRSWWLTVWTGSYEVKVQFYSLSPQYVMGFVAEQVAMVDAPDNLIRYIGVYIALSLAASIAGTLRFYLIRVASVRSSQVLFSSLLSAVMSAPLRWVDTVPLGRVLNRFTSDVYGMDYLLGSELADLSLWLMQTCGILVASVFVSPIVIVVAAVLLAASLKLSSIYLRAAREVKRLESVSRTPILEQFTSSLVGLSTIRAFGRTRQYIDSMFDRIDNYAKVSWNLWLLNWWLQLRISILGAIFCTAVAALVIQLNISASLAGFAISFLLQYNSAVSSMIKSYAGFEMAMNATERVIEYSNIDTESQDGLDPPAAWPTKGQIEVDNLVVTYAPDLPPALKGLSFTINPNERVGVVGRTGSGKSTLALALFRFMEPSEGRVLIDGQDTSSIKLQALRRGIAIVPQHPTLFTGTIRSNLDPFGWYSELQLVSALERVHLFSSDGIQSDSLTLDNVVSEGGANFSQGQRQLVCLARAILQQPKVMIMDEATSAVDMETDGYIQQAIRSEFGSNMSSLLVIAHRLSTIADFDKVLVLDEGQIVEMGSPRELLQIEGGAFQDLVRQSGERAVLERIILG